MLLFVPFLNPLFLIIFQFRLRKIIKPYIFIIVFTYKHIFPLFFRYDVPDEFMLPKSYSVDGRKLPEKGKEFDLLCLGALSIEVFTSMYLSRNMPDKVCCWTDDIYPQLFKVLAIKM